jgi:antitoxin component YwqK of YwqJK toxin-antitoxin module
MRAFWITLLWAFGVGAQPVAPIEGVRSTFTRDEAALRIASEKMIEPGAYTAAKRQGRTVQVVDQAHPSYAKARAHYEAGVAGLVATANQADAGRRAWYARTFGASGATNTGSATTHFLSDYDVTFKDKSACVAMVNQINADRVPGTRVRRIGQGDGSYYLDPVTDTKIWPPRTKPGRNTAAFYGRAARDIEVTSTHGGMFAATKDARWMKDPAGESLAHLKKMAMAQGVGDDYTVSKGGKKTLKVALRDPTTAKAVKSPMMRDYFAKFGDHQTKTQAYGTFGMKAGEAALVEGRIQRRAKLIAASAYKQTLLETRRIEAQRLGEVEGLKAQARVKLKAGDRKGAFALRRQAGALRRTVWAAKVSRIETRKVILNADPALGGLVLRAEAEVDGKPGKALAQRLKDRVAARLRADIAAPVDVTQPVLRHSVSKALKASARGIEYTQLIGGLTAGIEREYEAAAREGRAVSGWTLAKGLAGGAAPMAAVMKWPKVGRVFDAAMIPAMFDTWYQTREGLLDAYAQKHGVEHTGITMGLLATWGMVKAYTPVGMALKVIDDELNDGFDRADATGQPFDALRYGSNVFVRTMGEYTLMNTVMRFGTDRWNGVHEAKTGATLGERRLRMTLQGHTGRTLTRLSALRHELRVLKLSPRKGPRTQALVQKIERRYSQRMTRLKDLGQRARRIFKGTDRAASRVYDQIKLEGRLRALEATEAKLYRLAVAGLDDPLNRARYTELRNTYRDQVSALRRRAQAAFKTFGVDDIYVQRLLAELRVVRARLKTMDEATAPKAPAKPPASADTVHNEPNLKALKYVKHVVPPGASTEERTFPNGRRIETTKLGRKTVVERRWYSTGKKEIERTYSADGKPHGRHGAWYADGKPESVTGFQRGERHGVQKRWARTGELRSVTGWKAGKRHGVEQRYHKDGRIKEAQGYRDGEKHGTRRVYQREGEGLAEEWGYVAGKRHGTYRKWSAEGTLIKAAVYEADVLEGVSQTWSGNGMPTSWALLKAGKNHGPSYTWQISNRGPKVTYSVAGRRMDRAQYVLAQRGDASLPAPPPLPDTSASIVAVTNYEIPGGAKAYEITGPKRAAYFAGPLEMVGYRRWWPNGTLREARAFSRDAPHGVYQRFDKAGHVTGYTTERGGEKFGRSVRYEAGRPKSETFYVHDKAHGIGRGWPVPSWDRSQPFPLRRLSELGPQVSYQLKGRSVKRAEYAAAAARDALLPMPDDGPPDGGLADTTLVPGAGTYEVGTPRGYAFTFSTGNTLTRVQAWYPKTGTLKATVPYQGDRLHGVLKTFHRDGSPEGAYTYRNGVLHGSQQTWHVGGPLESKAQMNEGRYHGVYSMFDADGQLTHETEARMGVVLSSKSWYQGRLISERVYTVEDEAEGPVGQARTQRKGPMVQRTFRRDDGKPVKVVHHDAEGKQHGLQRYHYDNGAVEREQVFEHGVEMRLLWGNEDGTRRKASEVIDLASDRVVRRTYIEQGTARGQLGREVYLKGGRQHGIERNWRGDETYYLEGQRVTREVYLEAPDPLLPKPKG